MHAIEVDVEIDANGEIHIKLPERRQPGPARVIVLFEPERERPLKTTGHQPSLLHSADEGLDPGRDSATPRPSSDTLEPNDFAGIWADLPDKDFQGFLDEVAERRRRAFSGRPAR